MRARSRGGVLALSLLTGDRSLSLSYRDRSGERGRAAGRYDSPPPILVTSPSPRPSYLDSKIRVSRVLISLIASSLVGSSSRYLDHFRNLSNSSLCSGSGGRRKLSVIDKPPMSADN